jgi:hypothetical protein
MVNKDTLIKVINKDNGIVGYTVPDLGVHRNFYPGETKEVTYEELEKLSFIPGGMVILKELLEITDREATKQLFSKEPEPEYHYTKDDVKQLLLTGTLDQFLDCLDFAPEVIKDMIKDMAVDLPLNDIAKRQAIQEKLGFDVTRAIEIKNTKFDGGDEDNSEEYGRINKRRTAPIKEAIAPSGRRYKPENKE